MAEQLTFTMEETVWLNKGQEIEQVLSMSLEPEVSIEEKSDHVQIKGGLRLVGKYIPSAEKELERLDDESINFRSIDEMSENGEISHFFPIDVTIPLSRIENLEDIYVQVQSFDYDLAEKDCLQLIADVVITGINMGNKAENEPSEQERLLENEETTSFAFESIASIPAPPPLNIIPPMMGEKTEEVNNREDAGEKAVKEPRLEETKSIAKKGEAKETVAENVEEKEEERSKAQAEKTKQPSVVENTRELEKERGLEIIEAKGKRETKEEGTPEKREAKAESRQQIENVDERKDENIPDAKGEICLQIANTEERKAEFEGNEKEIESEAQKQEAIKETTKKAGQEIPLSLVETREAKEEALTETVKEKEEALERETVVKMAPQNKGEEMQEAKSEETPARPKKRRDENALYLTKMLANKEEKFSKLKICIVQANESLETIAKRYNVSMTQIIRLNRLENERVEEGQIVYIPVANNGS